MYSKKKHILVVLQRQTSVTWHITRTYKDINKINYNINILHFVKTQIPLLVFDFLFFKDYFCRVYSLGEAGKLPPECGKMWHTLFHQQKCFQRNETFFTRTTCLEWLIRNVVTIYSISIVTLTTSINTNYTIIITFLPLSSS